jgi:hypothetical protein
VRFTRVLRAMGSDQQDGGYDEGRPVGTPPSKRYGGSKDEMRLGMEDM